MDIRERVRTLRRQHGLTAEEVAQRIGLSRPFYTQLEGGKRRLTVEYRERIAQALDVSVADLYSDLSLSGRNKAAAEGKKYFKHLRPINNPALREKL